MGRWWWLLLLVAALAVGARLAEAPVGQAGAACAAAGVSRCSGETTAGGPTVGGSGLSPTAGSPLALTVTAAPAALAPGQGATFTLVVTVRRAVTVTYVTTQQYDFSLAPVGGRPVWLWSVGHLFGQVVYSVPLAAGETLTFATRWNGRDAEGHPLAAGSYLLTGVYRGLVDGAPTAVTTTITIR